MTDTTIVGWCPICRAAMIEDEPRVACDYRGRATGDYADRIDGKPQNYEGHPACVVQVTPDPEPEHFRCRA